MKKTKKIRAARKLARSSMQQTQQNSKRRASGTARGSNSAAKTFSKSAAGLQQIGAPAGFAKRDVETLKKLLGLYVENLLPDAKQQLEFNPWQKESFGVATLLIRLCQRLLMDWQIYTRTNQQAAFHFADTLAVHSGVLNLAVQQKPDYYAAFAPHLLRWPVALNARCEYKKEREEVLKMLRGLGVGSKHGNRFQKPLRGELGAKANAYLVSLIVQREFFGKELPPLTLATLPEYQREAFKFFEEEYGEKFEDHPEMERIAPRVLQSEKLKRWQRREKILDSWDGAFKTIAKQLARLESDTRQANAPKDSGKSDSENSETIKP
jgi:hypothetical protein